MAESWRAIPGYPGYEASSLGHVRSVPRVIAGGRRAGGVLLTETSDRKGYLRVQIGGKRVPVHKLVLLAWCGPCPDGMEACHGGGGQQDNTPLNLRYDTRSENALDRYRKVPGERANDGMEWSHREPSGFVTSVTVNDRTGE